ncbi:Fasciclin-like arabinogalactan protein 12 [Sarracenia purpurea var. burkii]
MMNWFFFSLSLLSLLILSHSTSTLAQSSAAQPPVPAGPPNITKILEKAGQFTVFLRLLGTTQVGNQINNQLNNSNNGMTVFAPTDNAFSSLQAGTLNTLNDEQKDELIQFHVLPSFLSISQFLTVSNPIRTQAGDAGAGKFPLNVTTSGNQVNISTGVVNATVDNTIYTDNQLAVYQVDKVLLPLSIFGTHATAPAPAPETPKKKKAPADAASSSSDDADSSDAGNLSGHSFHATVLVMIIGVRVCAAFLL